MLIIKYLLSALNFGVHVNLSLRGVQGKIIGTHDSGFWDREDRLKIGRPLGRNLNAQEAVERSRNTPGAEILVRNSGSPALNHHYNEVQRNPYESYDVYQVSVVDARGNIIPQKTLDSDDILANVDFKPDLINFFEDPQTGLVPAGLTLSSQDNKLADIKWKGGKINAEHLYTLASSTKALGKIPYTQHP